MQISTTRRWWHKLIGKDDAFYDLLEAGALEAQRSVHLLSAHLRAIAEGTPPPDAQALAESRRRQKAIRMRTVEELNSSLMPPFDREDIQALAFALYRIPKVIEKLVERIAIYPGPLPVQPFQQQAELLTIAADALVFMIRQLPSGADMVKVGEANARLQAAEGTADKTMLQLLGELYHSQHSPKELVILQSLYELLERAVDRCRDAGNVILKIALKNG
ncbi:MAG TPA: DUF47 domain-containing protein [Opitutus sp.]|nr:DUF47 domain-containing protein [Opitutus sp.]